MHAASMNWNEMFFKQHKNEISDITNKWEVKNTYVGSYMYFFVSTTLTEVKVIYILNVHNFSFIKGYPKSSA